MLLQIAAREYMVDMPLTFQQVAYSQVTGKEALVVPLDLAGQKDIEIGTSASSSLRSGVADFGNCWETAGHKEVSHAQEVRGSAVGGRADGL